MTVSSFLPHDESVVGPNIPLTPSGFDDGWLGVFPKKLHRSVQGYRRPDEWGLPTAWLEASLFAGYPVKKKYKKKKRKRDVKEKKKQSNPTWSRASWLRWWRWVTGKKVDNIVGFIAPPDAQGTVWCGAVPLGYQSAAAVCWLQHVLRSGSLRQLLLWSSPVTQLWNTFSFANAKYFIQCCKKKSAPKPTWVKGKMLCYNITLVEVKVTHTNTWVGVSKRLKVWNKM